MIAAIVLAVTFALSKAKMTLDGKVSKAASAA
jgi:hypothetical protein